MKPNPLQTIKTVSDLISRDRTPPIIGVRALAKALGISQKKARKLLEIHAHMNGQILVK